MSAWNLTGTGPPKPEIGSPGDAATGVQIVVQQLVGKDAVPVAGGGTRRSARMSRGRSS
jgi:hypothetical protein